MYTVKLTIWWRGNNSKRLCNCAPSSATDRIQKNTSRPIRYSSSQTQRLICPRHCVDHALLRLAMLQLLHLLQQLHTKCIRFPSLSETPRQYVSGLHINPAPQTTIAQGTIRWHISEYLVAVPRHRIYKQQGELRLFMFVNTNWKIQDFLELMLLYIWFQL